MLSDITVLDLSRVLAGPYCTQLLADLGATVWKVESPRGDETRAWGPPFSAGESAYYLSVNRNKRGLSVNLKDPRGVGIVQQLAREADVVVENFKTGDLARYGLDYESLRELNPRLVYASITGYGHSGPRAKEPGYDAAVQAMSGLMEMTGEKGGEPVKVGVAWVDVLAGVHAATAILAALHERQRTGVGQQFDIALLDVAMASMVNQGQSALLTGKAPQRLGSAHPSIVPYQAFPTKEGRIALAVGNDRQFANLCGVLGISDLVDDARFRTNDRRVENREDLLPLLERALAVRTRDEWLEEMRGAGVPASPVNTLPEALDEPQVAARGMVDRVVHPTIGELPMIMSPLGARARKRLQAPPRLGEHTRDILAGELGMTAEQIAELERDGVVRSLEGEGVELT